VLPSGSTLAADEDLLVVNVTMAPTAEELEAEGAGEVEEAAEVAPEAPEEAAAPEAPAAAAEETPAEQG
jgi:large subunit ribosomal protein L25